MLENPDKVREASTRWKKAHPEREREWERQRRLANPGRTHEHSKRWYLANRESASEYGRRRRLENLEELRAYFKRWKKENRDIVRAAEHRRRARKRAAGGVVTIEQIRQMFSTSVRRLIIASVTVGFSGSVDRFGDQTLPKIRDDHR